MGSEFEEKQYEELLNFELAEQRKIFPAGQVLEHTIAVDSAMYSRSPDFWGLWKQSSRAKGGVRLTRKLWDDLKSTINSDSFPRFKCNLFIQYKRPKLISSPNGKARGYWKRPYYRYEIDPHQQGILQKLEHRTRRNAIVVYACGAFDKWKDLWHFSTSTALVKNSNFVRPRSMKGHEKYTFVRGGRNGRGYSEPEELPLVDILKEIDTRVANNSESGSNTEFLFLLSAQIGNVAAEFPQEFAKIYAAMMRLIEFPQHELAGSISSILAFTFLTNLSWSVAFE